jgi:CBS domain-containing membrane protein
MTESRQPSRRPFRLFSPILAGATLKERLLACLGALAGISLTGIIASAMLGGGAHVPLLVAPMGATAVLLFAVPASPMAQPWPIIGGNVISALIGVAVAHLIHEPFLAAGVGVALAIAGMSLTRSLHPPGGAAALTAVLGGPAVTAWGWLFPIVPVGLNAAMIVLVGIAFHRLRRHNYPHRATAPNAHRTNDPPPADRVGFLEKDVDAALDALNEGYDIDRADLSRLLRQIEYQAAARVRGDILCRDVMSRDVISANLDDSAEHVRHLLLTHDIRTVPITDAAGALMGTVGLRELAKGAGPLAGRVSRAVTARAEDRALGLLPVLTDGRTHAVIVVDDRRNVVGLITQTDLLSLATTALIGAPGARAA